MEPCSQEHRIARMETAIDGIANKVDGLAAEFQLLKVKVEDVLTNVEEHDRALKGNNGTIGLIAKVANALDVLQELNEALKGKGEKPGLISTIANLSDVVREWKDDRKWVTRVILAWVLTTLLGAFIVTVR